ncbi:MAG TPA: D-2-hydroxyacid dehydrogenase [Candidatus Methylomirabilis sp.]|nr:D-2-hydroxyacid dehydrogenase [Candidatus Methylomirabilis sp.]
MGVSRIGILYSADPLHLHLDILPQHVETIRKTLPGASVIRALDEAELLHSGNDSEVLLTWGMYRPAAFCRAAQDLQWIHALSAGVDGLIAVPEISGRRIRVTATKGIHGLPIAEHVLGMMLSFARGFHVLRERQSRKEWKKYLEADEIHGKTAGILGLGNIGRIVAQKCKLMGMRVVALDIQPVEDRMVDHVYRMRDALALMQESDYVVTTLPLTPDTHHLVGEAQLRAMKKTAYLINVARGRIVDEPALIKALTEGWIAGAGLDVFENEPLPPTSELWSMPNVIISPHMSAISPYYMDRAIAVFCENLARFAQGNEMLYEINWDTGF